MQAVLELAMWLNTTLTLDPPASISQAVGDTGCMNCHTYLNLSVLEAPGTEFRGS